MMRFNESTTDQGIDLDDYDFEAERKILSDVRVEGTQLLLRRWIPKSNFYLKDGTKTSLIVPDSVKDEQTHTGMIGIVMQMGRDAYNHRYKNGPYCKIGDWVKFPRYQGMQSEIHQIACIYIEDSSVVSVLEKPTIVTER